MKLDDISVYFGCANMALSMVFGAIGAHKTTLTPDQRNSMYRAVNMHQLSALGFILLASNMFRYVREDGTREMAHLPFATLFVATLLFPGLIYVQTLANRKIWASKFIPTGGILQMLFWVELCFYYNPSSSL
jgi:uncharacterized membrane protein YgdD (TMEM256/DUF423 family)